MAQSTGPVDPVLVLALRGFSATVILLSDGVGGVLLQ